MSGVASDCDSIAFYDTLQASEAAHARDNQLLEPPPRVATALSHVPDSGGVTRATEPAAVCAATGSRLPECDRPLSLWLGTRLPARAALASSHAPLPLPALFPSLASHSHPATATAATRPLSPTADMHVEGNGARNTWDNGTRANSGRVASPLPTPPSPRAASAAAPAGGAVCTPGGEIQEASPLPARPLALLPPPSVEPAAAGAVASFTAPTGGAQEQRADETAAAEEGAGAPASDASRTEAEDEEAEEQEQMLTQATVREVAAPGFESFTASEARDDDLEGGCAPPAAQADNSKHLSGGRASTSSDDDARGGGSGSGSESDGGDEDGDDGDDAAEDASAGEGLRMCSDSVSQLLAGGAADAGEAGKAAGCEGGAPHSKDDGTPQPPPSHVTSRALDVLAVDIPPELELQLTAVGGGARSTGDADAAAAAPRASAVDELVAAIPRLWAAPGGRLCPLLSSRLPPFTRADVCAALPCRVGRETMRRALKRLVTDGVLVLVYKAQKIAGRSTAARYAPAGAAPAGAGAEEDAEEEAGRAPGGGGCACAAGSNEAAAPRIVVSSGELAAAIPALWASPHGPLLTLLSSRLRSFTRSDVQAALLPRIVALSGGVVSGALCRLVASGRLVVVGEAAAREATRYAPAGHATSDAGAAEEECGAGEATEARGGGSAAVYGDAAAPHAPISGKLADALPRLWVSPGGRLLPLLASGARSFTRADAFAALPPRIAARVDAEGRAVHRALQRLVGAGVLAVVSAAVGRSGARYAPTAPVDGGDGAEAGAAVGAAAAEGEAAEEEEEAEDEAGEAAEDAVADAGEGATRHPHHSVARVAALAASIPRLWAQPDGPLLSRLASGARAFTRAHVQAVLPPQLRRRTERADDAVCVALRQLVGEGALAVVREKSGRVPAQYAPAGLAAGAAASPAAAADEGAEEEEEDGARFSDSSDGSDGGVGDDDAGSPPLPRRRRGAALAASLPRLWASPCGALCPLLLRQRFFIINDVESALRTDGQLVCKSTVYSAMCRLVESGALAAVKRKPTQYSPAPGAPAGGGGPAEGEAEAEEDDGTRTSDDGGDGGDSGGSGGGDGDAPPLPAAAAALRWRRPSLCCGRRLGAPSARSFRGSARSPSPMWRQRCAALNGPRYQVARCTTHWPAS